MTRLWILPVIAFLSVTSACSLPRDEGDPECHTIRSVILPGVAELPGTFAEIPRGQVHNRFESADWDRGSDLSRGKAVIRASRVLSYRGTNGLQATHIELLSTVKGLQYIDLSPTNWLSDDAIALLRDLPNLVGLELGSTQCTDRVLKSVAKMSALRVLFIRYNQRITDSGLLALRNMRALRYLGLCSMSITGSTLCQLDFPLLETLELDDCHFLVGSFLDHASWAPTLYHLHISDCDFLDNYSAFESFKKLESLVSFRLSRSRVPKLSPTALTSLPKLRILDLQDVQWGSWFLRNVLASPHLVYLRISGNDVLTGSDRLQWGALAEVTFLVLSKTILADADIEEILDLPHLRYLDIRGCGVSSAIVASVRERRRDMVLIQ